MFVSKYKSHFVNIFRYFTASLLPLVLNLLINPWISKNMSPTDFATVGYYKSFTTLIQPFIWFYVLHYYTKSYYELDEENRKILRGNIFKFLIYGSLILSVISLIGIIIYSVYFNKESEIPLYPYVYISTFTIPLTGIYQLSLIDYRMGRKSGSYLVLSATHAILVFATLLIMVVFAKMGAFGHLTSLLLTNTILFVYCAYQSRDLFKVNIDWGLLRKIIIFCFPLTLAAMLSFFSGGYEKVYLERLGDIKELGFYVVGATMAGYIQVFSSAVGSTFQPDIYKAIAERNKKNYIKYGIVVIGFTTIITILVILLAPIIIDILTAGRYVYSAKYLRIIALSAVTSSVYYMVSQFTIAIGLTKIPLYNKVIGSILCIGMYKFMIDTWGFNGAAYGVALSFVVFTFGNLMLLYVQKTQFLKLWRKEV